MRSRIVAIAVTLSVLGHAVNTPAEVPIKEVIGTPHAHAGQNRGTILMIAANPAVSKQTGIHRTLPLLCFRPKGKKATSALAMKRGPMIILPNRLALLP